MGGNMADLTLEERTAIAVEKKRALERYEAAKKFDARVQAEYDRVMKERIWRPGSWRYRSVQLVDDIHDDDLREAVRNRVNAFIESIGGRGLPK